MTSFHYSTQAKKSSLGSLIWKTSHNTSFQQKLSSKAKHSLHSTHENFILPTKYSTPYHAWEIKFHNINPSTYQIIHLYNEFNE